jgi:hypothetical protein
MAVSIFDAFRIQTESLSNEVFRNATWSSVWLNLIERGEYPLGVGTTRSAFTVTNQQPVYDEEAWSTVSTSSGSLVNSCQTTYTQTGAGLDEKTYSPETFALQGPILCKDDLSLEFNAMTFIPPYVEEISKRARKAWENRYASIYEQIAPKYLVTGAKTYTVTTTQGTIATTVGNKITSGTQGTQAPATLTGMTTGVQLTGLSTTVYPGFDITQTVLDNIALELMYNGATNPDSNGFITLGNDGPIFSLYISPDASSRIIQEDTNTGFRTDLRYNDRNDPTDLLKRIGANRVIKNWRHVPDLFPARFGYGIALTTCNTTNASATVTITTGTSTNNFGMLAGGGQSWVADTVTGVYSAIYQGMPVTGTGIPANTYVLSVDTVSATGLNSLTLSQAATATGAVTLTFGTAGKFHRVPTWLTVDKSMSGGPTKGWKAVINPAWKIAPFEAARILSPRVFKSEIIRPINSVGDLNWNPLSTLGEFQWVTGAEKFSSGQVDPTQKYGIHIAEFKHAPRPMFPLHGGSIVYKRTTP